MKTPNIDQSDVLALLGMAILTVSAWMIYAPAGGIVAGAYLLAVASRRG